MGTCKQNSRLKSVWNELVCLCWLNLNLKRSKNGGKKEVRL